MESQKFKWYLIMIPISCYLISWFLQGWPASFGLVFWCLRTGVMSTVYNGDTPVGFWQTFSNSATNVADPVGFWELSNILAIVMVGVSSLTGLLLFWVLTEKRPRKRILAVLLMCLWSLFAGQATTGIIAVCYPRYNWLEVFGGDLWDGGTLYAPGFTKAGFAKIRIGMSREEVETLIGQGFSSRMNPVEYDGPVWIYSKAQGRVDSYWMYRIAFKNNVVSYKRMTFWRD